MRVASLFLFCLVFGFGINVNQLAAQQLPVLEETEIAALTAGALSFVVGDANGDGFDDYYLRETFSNFFGLSASPKLISGATGQSLKTYPGFGIGVTPSGNPVSVHGLGDPSGDGLFDIAEISTGTTTLGTVSELSIFSGLATTSYLFVTFPPGVTFTRADSVGDLNADGIGDIGLGGIIATGASSADSYYTVIDGVTAATLYVTQSSSLTLGSALRIGDINNDTHDDFLLSSTNFSNFVSGGGSASVISGADSSLLVNIFGFQPGEGLGTASLGLNDQDGDGLRDVLLFGPGYVATGQGTGRVAAFSSATGSLLWQAFAPAGGDFLEFRPAGDVDGDGQDDFAIRGTGLDPASDLVVYSGKDGRRLFAVDQTPVSQGLSIQYVVHGFVGDTNGDGFAEILQHDSAVQSNEQGLMLGVTNRKRTQHYGALPYGTATAGSPLTLDWEPLPGQAREGRIRLTGALPNANLLFGVSVAPWTGAKINGLHPLWISPLPQDLFLTTTTMANGLGEFRSFDSLRKPAIAGVSLYVQAAQTSLPDAVSNGLQLLYGN